MNLDDELRRMFSDDERLDLPLRDDAVPSVLTGARRLRRRRFVAITASGALAVATLVGGTMALAGMGGPQSLPAATPPTLAATAAPTAYPLSPGPASPPQGSASETITHATTSTSTARTRAANPPPKAAIGPAGYHDLTLGMPAERAEATGRIVPNSEPVSSKGCLGYDYQGSPNEPDHYSVVISPALGVVRIAGRADAMTEEGLTVGAPESELKRLYPTQSGTHGVTGEWVATVPANPDAQYWIIVRNQSVAEIRIELKTQDCYL